MPAVLLAIISGLDGTFSTIFSPTLTLVMALVLIFIIGNFAGTYLDK